MKEITLKDLLDAKTFQSLMDSFYALTGIGIGVIDINGDILVAKGWQIFV